MRSWLELVYPEAPDARAQFAADMESLQVELVWPEPPTAVDLKGLKRWLLDRDLAQADLARMCETSRQNLHQALSGKRPHIRLRQQLNGLGVPAELLGLKEAH